MERAVPRLRSALRSLFPPIDLRRLRFRGGIVALPLFLVLNLLYPLSLQQADWVATSGQLTYIAALAVLFGTIIGNGRLEVRRAGLLGIVLGTLVVLLLTSYADSTGTFRERALSVAVRVNNWLTQVVAGEAATDPTAFVLFLGASVWAASYLGSFALARERRVWDAIVLCGFCLLVNVSLALTSLLVDLVVFTLSALVLLVRLHIVELQERWRRQNIQPAGEMDWRVLRGGLTWTAVLVLMALATPRVGAAEAMSTTLTTFERPFQAVEAEWQRFFAGVSGPSRIRGVSFSDSIRLGLAPNLGDRIVFTVEAPEGGSGRFWRAVAYDFYTGAGWKTTETDRADTIVPTPGGREKRDFLFDVKVSHGNLLFSANEPAKASVPYQFQTGDDRSYSSSLRAANRSQAVGPYRVTSHVSTADKGALRRSAQNYPASIRQKYLQLPSSLPQRVRDKAREVAGGKTTAYDKAETLESWLRTTYRYSTVVKAAPPGRDPIDWFLFDLKEDFCEYFASAMVVMLRELGVPARLVEGYTTGDFDPTIGKYVVHEQNAHAWTEVYFTGYGWIEFEPTPSQPVFGRADELVGAPADGGSAADGDGATVSGREDRDLVSELTGDEGGFGDIGSAAARIVRNADPRPALAALVLVLLALVVAFARFQLRFRGMRPLDAAWGKTRLLSSYAGHAASPAQTAYEYAAALGRAVPDAGEPARTLAHVRVLDRYAPAGATEDQRAEAVEAWQRIARVLLSLLPQRIVARISRFIR